MRYIEQGIDKYGVTCWFVLDDAELIGEYSTPIPVSFPL